MYSRLQRAISYLLIFSILTLETVHVPFLDRIRADAPALYREIISIIVPATIYQ
jgi:hypothetical protein